LGIELTLLEGNACEHMTTPFECPINPGENILFNAEAMISQINPAVSYLKLLSSATLSIIYDCLHFRLKTFQLPFDFGPTIWEPTIRPSVVPPSE
jgi:hypothetical protein